MRMAMRKCFKKEIKKFFFRVLCSEAEIIPEGLFV